MNELTNVLVTGATGFLGRELTKHLVNSDKFKCSGTVRSEFKQKAPFCNLINVGELSEHTDWTSALINQDVIIHTAARAHIMRDNVAEPLAEYRKVNVGGTLNLARQAAEYGIKRFIFISSIKVNGERTLKGKPFLSEDIPAPEDAYGLSKLEAEQGLRKLAVETGMEVVIIRPTLVYGRNVKGNFANLIKLIEKGLPLPLGAVHNKRSMVALDNLVDLVITCIDHPAAANQVFLASDGEDISTTELLRKVAKAMGKKSRLIPIPAGLLMFSATLLGKKSMVQRLLGSLQVDISKARDLLGWRPLETMEEQLRKMFNS